MFSLVEIATVGFFAEDDDGLELIRTIVTGLARPLHLALGDDAIKRWINSQLNGASVTVVLIGAETFDRPWVNYEIQQSYADGKGMLGIYIHNLRDPRTGLTDNQGRNPFENIYLTDSNPRRYLSEFYPTYDWVYNDGYSNFSSWVETAAQRAKR